MILPDTAGGFNLFLSPLCVQEFHSAECLDGEIALFLRKWSGHWISGYIVYEAGLSQALPRSLRQKTMRSALFAVFEDPENVSSEALLQQMEVTESGFVLTQPVLTPKREKYCKDIRTIKELIAAGEVYQVNYTGRFHFGFSGSPLALFRELLKQQPVGYAAYLDTGDRQILSLSPELFFRIEGRRIITRPMKGTAPRGETAVEDVRSAGWLAASEKNRAENLMIVDLLRNDLGRIAVPGSVMVPELFKVEQYKTLYQMTSTVEAVLREDVTPDEILRALFPCGSITGAPKIRSMQIIRELEEEPRGIYTGAIGYFAPDGSAQFNVAIRTIEIRGHEAVMGAGGGIVADSDPEEEYRECLLKAGFLTKAAVRQNLELIETMLFDGGVVREKFHIARLVRSAGILGFCCEPESVRRILDKYVSALDSGKRYRVRLVLSREGGVKITSEPSAVQEDKVSAGIWKEPVSSGDPFLRIKTSWRPWFAAPLAFARKNGLADMILLNEYGQLTQGCISNVFVERAGVLYTPPVDCGLLPGVLREELLSDPARCREMVLYPEDLGEADDVYLGSSLRGLRKVTVVL